MKILIVDAMHPSIVEMPRDLGLEVDYFPDITFNEVLAKVPDYEGLIIRSKFKIDKSFLAYATKLKFIGRAGAGLDLIDVEACMAAGVQLFAANEGNRVAVAEHMIGMLLSLLHNIPKASQEVKNKIWLREENRGEELYGKTVGIIGFGNNGEAMAQRLVAFGCKVLAYDKYKYGFGDVFIEEVNMERIYAEADVLSLHIPLSDETQGLISESFLNSFRKNIYFCNGSRGEIAPIAAILNGLKSGKIKGAVLDVLEHEKLDKLTEEQKTEFEELAAYANVILSPHIAGWTHQSYKKINDVLRDKIQRYLASRV